MKTMKITEIQIIPIKPREGLVAFASVVVENSLYLGSLGVYTRIDGSGYRITYPTKKIGIKNINIYHPINKETSKAIEEAIISEAEKILTQ
jgi:stage V sporulation protein G